MKKNLAIKILLYLHPYRIDMTLNRLPDKFRQDRKFTTTIESLIGMKFITGSNDHFRIKGEGISYIESYLTYQGARWGRIQSAVLTFLLVVLTGVNVYLSFR